MLTFKKSLLFFVVTFIFSFTASAEDFYFPADQWGKANVSMPQSMRGLESLVSNQDNFEPIAKFPDSSRYRKISKAVGRLDILLSKNGASACTYCTASLIAQDRLITNYHCIPGLDSNYEVKKAALRMEYLSSEIGGEVFEVELPALESNRDLDYSILKVKGNPGSKYGVVPVKLRKPEPSELLFMVHHPAAQPKRITRQNCFALANNPIQGNDFRHRCDTLPGSSGSLIFSDDEELAIVALHKAGGANNTDQTSYNCGTPITQIQSKSNFFQNFSAKVTADTPNVSDDVPNAPVTINMGEVNIRAAIHTKFGDITLKFFPDIAPNHVKNFIELAKKGFYNGTTFHRVIPGFMIQGGDPNSKVHDKSKHGMGGPGYNVKAEFSQKPHKRGILSMARAGHPDSAGSQFFICLADANFLDGQYTVFGEVVSGMDVADKIVFQSRDARDNPNERVEMKIDVIEEKTKK